MLVNPFIKKVPKDWFVSKDEIAEAQHHATEVAARYRALFPKEKQPKND